MKMKKTDMKQINEMTDNFKLDILPPCESANVRFIASPEFSNACQQFGRVYMAEDISREMLCNRQRPGGSQAR